MPEMDKARQEEINLAEAQLRALDIAEGDLYEVLNSNTDPSRRAELLDRYVAHLQNNPLIDCPEALKIADRVVQLSLVIFENIKKRNYVLEFAWLNAIQTLSQKRDQIAFARGELKEILNPDVDPSDEMEN